MTSQDVIALILEASLAILSVFFGLFAVVAALLDDTITGMEKSEDDKKELREEYAEYRRFDILDPRRQKARDDLRDLTLVVQKYRSRLRLLNIGLALIVILILLSSFVAIYGFALLRKKIALDLLLSFSFYLLMTSPLISTAVIVLVMRRGHRRR